MDHVLMQVRGTNGIVTLYPDRVHIDRPGWINRRILARSPETELLVANIKDVELSVAPGGLAGHLSLHDALGRETYEDFSVSFIKTQLPRFKALAHAIEQQRQSFLASHVMPQIQVLPLEDKT